MKALGKKPPPNEYGKWGTPICTMELAEHFRQALLEAAKICSHEAGDTMWVREQHRFEALARKLRISAGEKS